MILPYQFPIVRFFGDDPEDCDVTYQDAQINLDAPCIEPYIAHISAPGSNFRLIFGKTSKDTIYLCVPNRASGFELGSLEDARDNVESMLWYCNNLDYEDICAIAFALKEISNVINNK